MVFQFLCLVFSSGESVGKCFKGLNLYEFKLFLIVSVPLSISLLSSKL